MHSDEYKNWMNVAHAVPWPCPRLHSEVLLFHYLFNHWSAFVSLLHAKPLPLEQFPLTVLHLNEIRIIFDSSNIPCLGAFGRQGDWHCTVDLFFFPRQESESVANSCIAKRNRARSQIQSLTSVCLLYAPAGDSLHPDWESWEVRSSSQPWSKG